jgi:hypothetical protein
MPPAKPNSQMKAKRPMPLSWELPRLLHDHGLGGLLPREPGHEEELSRRLDRGIRTSNEPIAVMLPDYVEVPSRIEKILFKLGIWVERVSDSEYGFESSAREPDFDYLQNHARGKFANDNGLAGEKAFRSWCFKRGYLYIKTKHLPAHFKKQPRTADKAFWTIIADCVACVSKPTLAAIQRYMRRHGFGIYGEIPGMADFYVIHEKQKRDQFFVEVKAHSRIRLSESQLGAAAFFKRHKVQTKIWRADVQSFDEESSK